MSSFTVHGVIQAFQSVNSANSGVLNQLGLLSWRAAAATDAEAGGRLQRVLQYMELKANAGSSTFEVLTAAGILKAKSTEQLKNVVREKPEERDNSDEHPAPFSEVFFMGPWPSPNVLVYLTQGDR